ncbi:hypothetical protein C8J56DRAFT_458816 [Mycena floridula]|nr:hypothetical protein C8J56DRAFT_458816 [Mycena floridula]
MRKAPPRAAPAAHDSILDLFANELLIEIISLVCNTRSLAALCRVCKLFNQLAHHEMYRTVRLKPKNTISFNRVICENPRYAVWVKELSILAFREKEKKSIHYILGRTTELQQLSIEWRQDMLPDLGSLSLFPRLCTVNLDGPVSLQDHKIIIQQAPAPFTRPQMLDVAMSNIQLFTARPR